MEANLKVLTRYLVATFPDTSILSREIGGHYHLFIIVPFTDGAEKAIQVDRVILADPALTEEEMVFRLDSLHLPSPAQMRRVRPQASQLVAWNFSLDRLLIIS